LQAARRAFIYSLPATIEKLAFRVHAYAYLRCALVVALAGHVEHRLRVIDQIHELVRRVAHAFRHGDRGAAVTVRWNEVNIRGRKYNVSGDRRGRDGIRSVNDNNYVSGDM
jgi:hypothetical protein